MVAVAVVVVVVVGRPNEKPYPGNPLLPDVSRYLETAGINSPITKIYITTDALEGLPCLMFLFVLAQLQHLSWSRKLSTLMCNNKNQPLDGAPLVVGVITLLKQFHSSHTHTFLAYCGQYVRAMISAQAAAAASGISGGKGIPPHCVTVLLFLEEFCKSVPTHPSPHARPPAPPDSVGVGCSLVCCLRRRLHHCVATDSVICRANRLTRLCRRTSLIDSSTKPTARGTALTTPLKRCISLCQFFSCFCLSTSAVFRLLLIAITDPTIDSPAHPHVKPGSSSHRKARSFDFADRDQIFRKRSS